MLIENDDATDEDLITSIQDQIRCGIEEVAPGSPAARQWARFWAIYSGTIRRTAASYGVRGDACDEILSDVCVKLLKSLPEYRRTAQAGSFRRWLHTLVRTTTIDRFRREKLRRTRSLTSIREDQLPTALIDPGPEEGDMYDRCWTIDLINSVIDLFRAADPDIRLFEMHVLDGRGIDEIAGEANLAPRRVIERIHRVKERLRKAVNYFIGEETK